MQQPSVRAGGSSAPQLEGSWQVAVTTGSGQSTSLATFTRGGGLIVSDNDNNSSSGHGTWVKTGDHTYAVTFVILLSDPQGNFIGTVKVRSAIQLDPQTDTFNGPEQVIVTIGGNTVASFCGTVQGERISVELPECQ